MSGFDLCDFFISYARADEAWATWIASELERAGFSTVVQAWDFHAGANFVALMHEASKCRRTVAVLSPSYFDSRWTTEEWTAAFAGNKLLPVRVRECEPEGLIGTRVYIELVGKSEEQARHELVHRVSPRVVDRKARQPFPGAAAPSFPGKLPTLWNVPLSRNPNFTGRDSLLEQLRAALRSGRAAALTQAISGLGGVGKTQLALEYCYRYATDYGCIWWVRAEESPALAEGFASLAVRLGLAEPEPSAQQAAITAALGWFRENTGWLLVLDNAADEKTVRSFLPQSTVGHVLVTSHSQIWRATAQPLPVPVMDRADSVAFLEKRTGRQDAAADELAKAVDDLPLALEHAAAYMEATGITTADYVERFKAHAGKLLRRAESANYPLSVAATWEISIERLEQKTPDAVALLNILAFFGPDDIPRELAASGSADSIAFDDAIAGLRRYSLIAVGDGSLSVHRLVQVVTIERLRARGLESENAAAAAESADRAFQYEKDDLTTWNLAGRLVPHALTAAGHAGRLDVGQEAAARLLNEAGLYLLNRGQLGAALEAIQRASAIDEKVVGPDHPNVARDANNIGSILHAQGDLDGALQFTKRALAIDEKVFGPDHPNVASFANNIGQILKAQGDLEGALQFTQRALAIDEKVYGPHHPNVAIRASNIGSILHAQGDLDGALQFTKRALAIGEEVYGSDHPNVAIRASNIGQIRQAQGDLDGALDYSQRALAIGEKVYGPDHPTVAIRASNIGQILQAKGDLDGALQYTQRALAIDERVYGSEHPEVATDASNIGQILKAKGDLAGAIRFSERALRILESTYGSANPRTRTAAANLARLRTLVSSGPSG